MTERILIVDDNPIETAILRETLQQQDYLVDSVSSGEEALDSVSRQSPDLILLDVMMEGIDGFETCRRLTPYLAETAVVFVTKKSDLDSLKIGLDAGGVDYICRPVNPVELLSRVKSHLRTVRLQQMLRQQLEQQLQTTHRLADAGIAAAKVAHEFRNMLQPVIGLSELWVNRNTAEHADYQHLTMVHQGAVRAATLAKQLLELVEQQQISPQTKEPVSVGELLHELVKLLAVKKSEHIVIDFVTCGDCETTYVWGNQTQLWQLLLNLCNNALEAMSQEGQLEISLREQQGWLEISIHDTGEGMSDDTVAQIFDPLFSTRKQQGGCGLGLVLVKDIVAFHEGTIEVSSQFGQGTCFRVSFPQHQIT
jgi:two-component system, sensor histidine kinase and response regulator